MSGGERGGGGGSRMGGKQDNKAGMDGMVWPGYGLVVAVVVEVG